MHALHSVGVLLFSEADLQYAAYWCKDRCKEDQEDLLKQYNEVWRYIHASIQTTCIIMHLMFITQCIRTCMHVIVWIRCYNLIHCVMYSYVQVCLGSSQWDVQEESDS